MLFIVITLIISYILGAIPFGLLVVKVFTGKDIRKIASGRTGGTNAMRAAGLFSGLLTGVLDILKGVATGWIAAWMVPGNIWVPGGCRHPGNSRSQLFHLSDRTK